MTRWERQLADSIIAPADLARRFGFDSAPLLRVASRYPLRITPYYLSLITAVADPIGRQCIPDTSELVDTFSPDPLDEENLSPVPGLIHRYPDRVVWLVANACAVYCRFCLRKRQVGCVSTAPSGTKGEVLAYISSTPAIREVILSGGDPLLLQDDEIRDLLTAIRSIPHVKIIRIHSRVPVTLPQRITAPLCRILKAQHPLYITTHFNHPREITSESALACAKLADAGVPLGNQTVLLKGVNDNSLVMTELLQQLLAIRVKPYYIHQLDLVRGTGHFRTSIAKGLAIMGEVRSHISGLATPYYVLDLPGGKGKVPLLPEQVRWHKKHLEIRTYQGETVTYQLQTDDVKVPRS